MERGERRFWEAQGTWNRFTLNAVTEEKVRQLRELVPEGTRTILDVGCGNGIITNQLADDYRVTGLDWSAQALRSVRGARICSSSAALPLPPGVFDLILCTELLEHLAPPDLGATVAEMERLRPRHLLLTVPDRENIHLNEVTCGSCGQTFHASHHRNSFSGVTLAALFARYRTVATRTGGPPVRAYPLPLLRIRQRLGRRGFQVPDGRCVMCPACGNTRFPRTPHNPISFVCDGLNRLISHRRPQWLYLLLARHEASSPG